MDVPADTARAGHGKMSPFRWDTSTQLATLVAIALVAAVALNMRLKAQVKIGK